MNTPDPVAKNPTDEEIADTVINMLLDAARTLTEHSTKRDYHMTVIRMAAQHITDAARVLQHLKGPIPQPYRPGPEQGPGVGFKNGPKRFRVNIKLTRPAIFVGKDRWGNEITENLDDDTIKKWERPTYYDYGSTAANNAEMYAYRIGEWVESVRVTDRLDKIMWTYDKDGNCAELRVE